MGIINQYSRTSARTEAKQRYNEKHYDQIKFYSPKGSRDIIQQLAAASGQSMAEYIRTLVIRDADRHGIDVRAALGGGADSTMTALPLRSPATGGTEAAAVRCAALRSLGGLVPPLAGSGGRQAAAGQVWRVRAPLRGAPLRRRFYRMGWQRDCSPRQRSDPQTPASVCVPLENHVSADKTEHLFR